MNVVKASWKFYFYETGHKQSRLYTDILVPWCMPFIATSGIHFSFSTAFPIAAVCCGSVKLCTAVFKWHCVVKCFIWWGFRGLICMWEKIKIRWLEWATWADRSTFWWRLLRLGQGWWDSSCLWNLRAFTLGHENNLKLASVYVNVLDCNLWQFRRCCPTDHSGCGGKKLVSMHWGVCRGGCQLSSAKKNQFSAVSALEP